MKYRKVKWEQVPDIDKVSDGYLQQLNQRNAFHSFHMNQWFKQKPENIKPQYLYYPEERRLQMELKQIFLTLDCNNQGVLTLTHMFLLFKHFGFSVNYNDLQTIYSYIDYNKDNALSMDEFKGFTENPSALQAFRKMMTKMQTTMSYDKYVPLSVGAMLNHINYLVQREKRLKDIMSEQSIPVKFQAFRMLIQDTEKKTIADEAYTLYLKAQVEFHSKLKRQNSLGHFERSSVRKSFSTVNGLQPLLFRNMLMKDANELQDLAKMMRMQSRVKIESFESVSEEDSSLSHIESGDLERVVLKAQQEGKKLARQEIDALLKNASTKSKISLHQKQLSVTIEDLPPLQFNLQKSHSTKNKSMLERQLKLQKLIPSEDLCQFNFLSSARSNKNQSLLTQEQTTQSKEVDNQSCWSNRILSLKLPTLA